MPLVDELMVRPRLSVSVKVCSCSWSVGLSARAEKFKGTGVVLRASGSSRSGGNPVPLPPLNVRWWRGGGEGGDEEDESGDEDEGSTSNSTAPNSGGIGTSDDVRRPMAVAETTGDVGAAVGNVGEAGWDMGSPSGVMCS